MAIWSILQAHEIFCPYRNAAERLTSGRSGGLAFLGTSKSRTSILPATVQFVAAGLVQS
jgi:hypothetical protein